MAEGYLLFFLLLHGRQCMHWLYLVPFFRVSMQHWIHFAPEALTSQASVFFPNRIVFFPKIKLIGGTVSARRFLSNLFWSVMFCDLKRCVL